MFKILVVALTIFVSQNGFATALFEKGSFGITSLVSLYPTQNTADGESVEKEYETLRRAKEKGPKTFTQYAISRRARVIIGPEQKLFLVSGYPEVLAFYRAGIERIQIFVEEDFSTQTEEEFGETLKKYTKTTDDNPRYVSQLKLTPHGISIQKTEGAIAVRPRPSKNSQ